MKAKSVNFGVWYEVFPCPKGKAQKDQTSLFEGLETAVDGLSQARETEKIAVKETLAFHGVSSMATFFKVFVPENPELWPVKKDGTPLTPQAVCNRTDAGKECPDWAIVAAPYLRALERGVRRIEADNGTGKVVSKRRTDKTSSTDSGTDKTSSTDSGTDKTSARYITVQAQIDVYDAIVSGAISALGKADAAVVLSAIIAECQAKAQGARLELLKLQGKAAPDTGKSKGKGKAIKIFA